MPLRPGRDRRPAERRQVDLAERAGRPEDQHHLEQGADDAASHHRHPHPRPSRSSCSSTRPASRLATSPRSTASLNRAVTGTLSDVDVVLLVVEAGRFGADDAAVLALVDPAKPVLLIANKLDTVTRRADLAPWLQDDADAPRLRRVRADGGDQGGRRRAAADASSSPTCRSSPGSTTKTRSPTGATASSPPRSFARSCSA